MFSVTASSLSAPFDKSASVAGLTMLQQHRQPTGKYPSFRGRHPNWATARTMNGDIEGVLLPVVLAIVAAAYATVGQAGATGYIAVMGLIGFTPDFIRPAALTLNVLVSVIGTAQFARAGLLRWRAFYPFALLGVPCSILGGVTRLPANIYHPVVGALLLYAAWRLARSARKAVRADTMDKEDPPLIVTVLAGAVVGFAAGITGIGGGILLAPLMLLENGERSARLSVCRPRLIS
jgi:uncharacterized membrane protein YfcA